MLTGAKYNCRTEIVQSIINHPGQVHQCGSQIGRDRYQRRCIIVHDYMRNSRVRCVHCMTCQMRIPTSCSIFISLIYIITMYLYEPKSEKRYPTHIDRATFSNPHITIWSRRKDNMINKMGKMIYLVVHFTIICC